MVMMFTQRSYCRATPDHFTPGVYTLGGSGGMRVDADPGLCLGYYRGKPVKIWKSVSILFLFICFTIENPSICNVLL